MRLGADQLDPLGEARDRRPWSPSARRSAPFAKRRPAPAKSSVSMRCRRVVPVIAATSATGPVRLSSEVEGVDRLGDQHAAAVARQRAAARARRSSSAAATRGRSTLAAASSPSAPSLEPRPQMLRGFAEAELEHDPELDARGLGRLDQAQRPLGRALERLLQQDVLAGGGETLDQLQMRAGRRQDHHRIERVIARRSAPGRRWSESRSARQRPGAAPRSG